MGWKGRYTRGVLQSLLKSSPLSSLTLPITSTESMQLLGKNARQLRQDVLSSWGGKVCMDTHMFIIRPPLNVCLPTQLILQREGSLKHPPVSSSHSSANNVADAPACL